MYRAYHYQRQPSRHHSLWILGVVAFGVLLVSTTVVALQWKQQQIVLASVQSGSMSPALDKGDTVVTVKVEPTSIAVGDVVSYADPDRPAVIISHRVVSVDSFTGRLVTKGDANASPDKPTSALTVMGKVRYVMPATGFIIDGLHSWYGLVALVYVPAGLVVLVELRSLSRRYLQPTYHLR